MLSLKKIFERVLLETSKPGIGWLNLTTGQFVNSANADHYAVFALHLAKSPGMPEIHSYQKNEILRMAGRVGWVRLANATEKEIAIEVFSERPEQIKGLQDFSNKYYPRADFFIDAVGSLMSYTVPHKEFMQVDKYKDLRAFSSHFEKLKEALPPLPDDEEELNIAWLKKPEPRKPLPSKIPVRREDLEIEVDQTRDGFYRATIKSVKGKPYGSSLSHPEEFMASGRTPEAAKEELFKKLKI